MILTCLLYTYFTYDLSNFPDHVIYVSKQDVSIIETINFKSDKFSSVNLTSSTSTIDLSKLLNLRNLLNALIIIVIYS